MGGGNDLQRGMGARALTRCVWGRARVRVLAACALPFLLASWPQLFGGGAPPGGGRGGGRGACCVGACGRCALHTGRGAGAMRRARRRGCAALLCPCVVLFHAKARCGGETCARGAWRREGTPAPTPLWQAAQGVARVDHGVQCTEPAVPRPPPPVLLPPGWRAFQRWLYKAPPRHPVWLACCAWDCVAGSPAWWQPRTCAPAHGERATHARLPPPSARARQATPSSPAQPVGSACLLATCRNLCPLPSAAPPRERVPGNARQGTEDCGGPFVTHDSVPEGHSACRHRACLLAGRHVCPYTRGVPGGRQACDAPWCARTGKGHAHRRRPRLADDVTLATIPVPLGSACASTPLTCGYETNGSGDALPVAHMRRMSRCGCACPTVVAPCAPSCCETCTGAVRAWLTCACDALRAWCVGGAGPAHACPLALGDGTLPSLSPYNHVDSAV